MGIAFGETSRPKNPYCYPPMKGRKYRVVIRELPHGNLDDFIDIVLEPYYARKGNLMVLAEGIKIIDDHLPEWVILEILPSFWQGMLPTMMKIKNEYKVDWDYKILDV